MFALRPNRTRKAWLVLAAFASIYAPWLAAKWALGRAGGVGVGVGRALDPVLFSLVFALTAVWLLSAHLKRKKRPAAFFSAWLVGVLACAVGMSSSEGFFLQAVLNGFAAAAMLTVFLAALALAGVWRRKGGCTARRFMLRLFASSVVIGIGVGGVLFAVLLLFLVQASVPFFAVLCAFAAYSLILGVVPFLVGLPFTILAMRSAFWRERLCAVFRLPGMTAEVEAAAAEPTGPDRSLGAEGGPRESRDAQGADDGP